MDRKNLVTAVAALSLLTLVACGRKDETIDSGAGENAAGQPTINTTAPEPESPQSERSANQAAGQAAGQTATATLQGAPEDTDFTGTVTLTPEGNGVRVVAHVSGVDTNGPHAIHVHATGECAHDPAGKHFTSAGGHFNPANVEHACPDSPTRHAGDLGNIDITNGSGHLEATTELLSLTGPNSAVGKAIILHTGTDDCKTQPTGNAGDRLACGVFTMGGEAGQTGHAGGTTPHGQQ